MSVIEMTRKLGAEIQKDERYLKFSEARKANDADKELNDLIGKLNLIQLSYQQEAGREGADEAKMAEYDKEFRELYGKIMSNPNMQAYEAARHEVDEMMNYVMQLLSLCVNGENPETCEVPVQEHSCGGECGSCGGCH